MNGRNVMPKARFVQIVVKLVFLLCAPAILAQEKAPSHPAVYDATQLGEPVEIFATGVAAGGDDPAFALPNFDDSKWVPVDDKRSLRQTFPQGDPEVLWQRLRIRVNPARKGLAIEVYGLSRAFEIYINGQRLLESGRVSPPAEDTDAARLVVGIPDAQTATGTLVIAIRARTMPLWWKSTRPAFPPRLLILGRQTELRNQVWMEIVGANAINWAVGLFAFGVSVVAFSLYTAQRQQREYLWLSLVGLASTIQLCIEIAESFQSIPIFFAYANQFMEYAGGVCLILMMFAFVRRKLEGWLSILLVLSVAAPILADWAYLHGDLTHTYVDLIGIPYSCLFSVAVPLLLLVQLRRGNREAGILLIPIILFSLFIYMGIAATVLNLIPSFRGSVAKFNSQVDSFSAGPFSLNFGSMMAFLFFLSMVVIVVLRSTRTSRQQAILEGELSAAAEVQQVILPETIEPIPGFTVESVYLPAQQVGGDFFQVLPTKDGGLLLVLGDVAGKGLPAAMLVSVLVGAIRATAEYTHDPAALLASLNERLIGRANGGFSTALAAYISESGMVTIANAGHLSPYLDGEELELPGALPLGIVSGTTFETTRLHLSPARRLTFYSDGVIEAQNQKGELFGFDRSQAISTQPAAAIVEAAKQFGQCDDITVVAIARADAVANAA